MYTDVTARAAHCLFKVDRVALDPESTSWKRHARWHQAQWREARGHPIGAHPYAGGDGATLVGSRLALEFAMRRKGENFLTPAILGAVGDRLEKFEKHQMLREDRLWADLLSSMPLCFNLFGDLFRNNEYATRAVRAWWPDAPQGSVAVRFEHSPARCDPTFLGNKSAFDVAFEIGLGGEKRAIIGVETKYHEHARVEPLPQPKALARYTEVTERSSAFVEGWRELVIGTALQQIWLDHLLVLAMLQHPSGQWSWGRFVLVYPSGNPSFARAAAAYRAVLRDPTTFHTSTIEDILATPGALDLATVAAFRERYFW
jgi:hypothetical protein